MGLLKAIVELLMILLLVRLLIRPNEAFFHPLSQLIYRITDPILIPTRYVTRTPLQGILLAVLALVALRGVLYASLGPITISSGVGTSLLELFRLLFHAYMVMWVVSALAGRGYGTPAIHMIARAFLPVDAALRVFGVPRNRFLPAAFLFLWILFAVLSVAVQSVLILQDVPSVASLIHGLAVGLLLFLSLFPFPGFFSVLLIVGVLLSWVSPDPHNPVVQAIYGITEPILAPFRRFIPNLGGLDISPILALFAFQLLGSMGQQLVIELLRALTS